MRRPGELGVHSLDHFHFVVPDLSTAQDFYSEFGLAVTEKGAGLALGVHGQPHVWERSEKGRARNTSTSPSAPSTTTSTASPGGCRTWG